MVTGVRVVLGMALALQLKVSRHEDSIFSHYLRGYWSCASFYRPSFACFISSHIRTTGTPGQSPRHIKVRLAISPSSGQQTGSLTYPNPPTESASKTSSIFMLTFANFTCFLDLHCHGA